VPVADRVALVHALQGAGLRHIEVTAFVSPKAVPAMSGAAEVVAEVDRLAGVTYAALVPNERGAELALVAGVDELTVTISASEAYNERNVHMSTGASERVIAGICRSAEVAGVPVDAVVSCAFGSPYEPDQPVDEIAALGRRLLDGGCARITYADTTGMATPPRIDDLVSATGPEIGLHLHQTRGTALLCAFHALTLGVTRFDTAIGGLGGSPFAHGAGGNLATEELVAVLDDCDVFTGIDIDRLLLAADRVERLVGRPLPSGVARSGPRSRRAPIDA